MSVKRSARVGSDHRANYARSESFRKPSSFSADADQPCALCPNEIRVGDSVLVWTSEPRRLVHYTCARALA